MIASIIVNYFGHQLTKKAVGSLLAHQPDMEIIVVDNSIDFQEARELRATLDQRVHIISSTSNLGFGRACNLAFESTKAEFIMLLNPDAQVLPGCIEQLVQALQRMPKLGAVSPVQIWEPSGCWKLPPAWLPTGLGMWCIEHAWRNERNAVKLSNAYRNLALKVWHPQGCQVLPQRALSGGAMMVRRSAAIESGGLFDPDFFMYYEDSDLCWRLKSQGWQLGMVANAFALHEWEHTSTKVDFMEKSKHAYIHKHFSGCGTWEQRIERCTKHPPLQAPIQFQKGSKFHPWIQIPEQWQASWLLEISPSPLLIPSIGFISSGPQAHIPDILIQRLGGEDFYVRVGPARQTTEALRVFRFI